MNMINVMIPFLNRDFIFISNILEYFTKSCGNRIIDDAPSVLDHKNQMIMKCENRMVVVEQFHSIYNISTSYIPIIKPLQHMSIPFKNSITKNSAYFPPSLTGMDDTAERGKA